VIILYKLPGNCSFSFEETELCAPNMVLQPSDAKPKFNHTYIIVFKKNKYILVGKNYICINTNFKSSNSTYILYVMIS